MTELKKDLADFIDALAGERQHWMKKNWHYYQDQIAFLRYNIPAGKSVLEIGCGTGSILAALQPSRGVGIDISAKMIDEARKNLFQLTKLEFICADAEELELSEKFDFIIVSDTLGYFSDIQQVFGRLKKCAHSQTRFIFTYHNFLWWPLLELGQKFNLKMPQKRLNWLNHQDIANLLYVEGYDIIKSGKRLLLPLNLGFVSSFINRYLGNLPLLNRLCLIEYSIARLPVAAPESTVSVIIPARNEKGNIEQAVLRVPPMGRTEIVFIEGGSNDGTWEEILRVAEKYKDSHRIKYAKQDGKGKGDAVRKGFAMAENDILMIQDADLTAPPEDLDKFYEAISSGCGEYINGSRLVYPMEKEAMRFLNMLANKTFSIIFSWLLGQRMKDTLCGTKVLSRTNYLQLAANRDYFGDFDPFGDFDLIFGAAKMNLKIVEIPVRYRAREYGETQISRFSHGWLLIKMVAFALNKIKFI